MLARLALAATIAAAALAPAVAHADPSLTLSLGDPVAGTAAAPAPVLASLGFAADPAVPAGGGLSAITVAAGPGLALGAPAGMPGCAATQVAADDRACPLGSLVGAGTLTAATLGATVKLDLTLYNGVAPDALVVLVTGPPGLPIRAVVPGTLDDQATAVTLTLPPQLTQPLPGVRPHVAGLDVTLGPAPDVTGSWVRTTSCPGSWTASLSVAGTSGSTDQANGTAPCTQGAGDPGGAAPLATTGAADGITPTAATVHGTVDRVALTTVEYGPTTAYGSHAGARAAAPGTPAGLPLAGLSPETTYHFRLVAFGPHGTSRGQDATFTTPAAPPPPAEPVVEGPPALLPRPAASDRPTLGLVAASGIRASGRRALLDTGIELRCPAGGPACTAEGTLRLRRGKVVLGRVTLKVAAGRAKRVRIPLDASGLRRLRRAHRLDAAFTLVATPAPDRVSFTRNARLVLPRALR